MCMQHCESDYIIRIQDVSWNDMFLPLTNQYHFTLNKRVWNERATDITLDSKGMFIRRSTAYPSYKYFDRRVFIAVVFCQYIWLPLVDKENLAYIDGM